MAAKVETCEHMARAAVSRNPAGEGSLRAAHKSLTRGRIRDAAKALFSEGGVLSTTVDQIAAAAGVSRQTFYVHFRDKEEVLTEIVRAFAERSATIHRQIEGPEATVAAVRGWLEQVVALYREDLASLALLYQAGHVLGAASHEVARDFMRDTLETLAAQWPALRVALEPGPHQPHARVRAEMLVRQATSACEFCAREGETPSHEAALAITADAFVDFVRWLNDLPVTAAGAGRG
jgi:AcrR family transcriptional regulator